MPIQSGHIALEGPIVIDVRCMYAYTIHSIYIWYVVCVVGACVRIHIVHTKGDKFWGLNLLKFVVRLSLFWSIHYRSEISLY